MRVTPRSGVVDAVATDQKQSADDQRPGQEQEPYEPEAGEGEERTAVVRRQEAVSVGDGERRARRLSPTIGVHSTDGVRARVLVTGNCERAVGSGVTSLREHPPERPDDGRG